MRNGGESRMGYNIHWSAAGKAIGMKDNRKEYLDRLLRELRLLEEKVDAARENETLSFSFFNDAFDRMQHISRLLQQLQSIQIEEMKGQMERLVAILSEKSEPVLIARPQSGKNEAEQPNEVIQQNVEERSMDRVMLPGYKNPRPSEPSPVEPPYSPPVMREREEKPGTPSLNDVIQTPPSLLDLKRGISLNDRFLFQRELFHNNREEMNNIMISLNAFERYEKAEDYLKETMEWNFDEPVVQDFLRIIRKGFA